MPQKITRTKPKPNLKISTSRGADLRDRPELGRWGELQAVNHIQSLGWTILEQNWRDRFGEGDIVAENEGCIILVEVKTKTNLNYGDPAEMITLAKQRKLRQLASRLMQRYTKPVRVDVVTVLRLPSGETELHHYPGAINDKKL